MTALPLLLRECRLEARRSQNYWLRALGVGFMVVAFFALASWEERSATLFGARLFPQFHTVLLFAIVLTAPLLTADCLAQEKREGTLQLLLLTRLTASGVVAAKTIVHALRGLAMVAAALPLLGLPFLMGGVSLVEGKISVLLDLSFLLLSLAGGVAASAVVRSWARACVVAMLFSFLLLLLFSTSYYACFNGLILPLTGQPSPPPFSSLDQVVVGILQAVADYRGYWGRTMAQLSVAGDEAWLALLQVFFLGSVLVAVLLMQLSGRLILFRGEETGGVRQASLASTERNSESDRLLQPGWSRSANRRWCRRVLRTNPIYWLQQRSLFARSTKWGWCIAVLLVEGLLLISHQITDWLTGQALVGLILMLGLVYAAACSYRLEKENGILELILVTPLPAWKLVTGRVRALWVQFAPAYLVWIACGILYESSHLQQRNLLVFDCFASNVLLFAPVVGVDCARSFHGHWRAFLVASASVVVVPGMVFLLTMGEGWLAVLLSGLILSVVGILSTAGLALYMSERKLRYFHPHSIRRHRRRHRRQGRSVLAPMRPVGSLRRGDWGSRL